MSITDKIATVTGLNYILTRQQAKQGGAIKELATASRSTGKNGAVVLRDADLAGKVISASSEALKSVGATLTKALSVAKEAMLTTPDQREALADQFNGLIKQAKDLADNATVKGVNLVGSDAKPIMVNTTVQ